MLVGMGPGRIGSVGVGSDGSVLTADHTASAGVRWMAGMGGLIPSGPAQNHTFVSGDIADPASYWGATAVKILPTWTPTESGSLLFVAPADNGDPNWAAQELAVYIWEGDVANVDYPDATSASGSFGTGTNPQYLFKSMATVFSNFVQAVTYHVTAGQTYTIILNDTSGLAGSTLDLAATMNCLYQFGGWSTLPPPPPVGLVNWSVAKDAAGQLVWVAGPIDDAGVGQSCTAFGGDDAGNSAGGSYSLAEGSLTSTLGFRCHAEGYKTIAGGVTSHAEGYHTHTYRVSEHGTSGGQFTDGSPAQVSTFTACRETADATPSNLVIGYGNGMVQTVDMPLTETTLSTVSGRIGARNSDGSVCKSWSFVATVDRAASTSRMVGSPTITVLAADSGASAWTITLATSTNGVAIVATGQAATTIRWVGSIEIVETRFGQT
jgi:hypothetical protein